MILLIYKNFTSYFKVGKDVTKSTYFTVCNDIIDTYIKILHHILKLRVHPPLHPSVFSNFIMPWEPPLIRYFIDSTKIWGNITLLYYLYSKPVFRQLQYFFFTHLWTHIELHAWQIQKKGQPYLFVDPLEYNSLTPVKNYWRSRLYIAFIW